MVHAKFVLLLFVLVTGCVLYDVWPVFLNIIEMGLQTGLSNTEKVHKIWASYKVQIIFEQ
jgi:hypothetical protein